MSIFRNHLPLMGASGQATGFDIEQSIRFDWDSSSYLTKNNYSGSGTRTTYTVSFWFRIGQKNDPPDNDYGWIFGATDASGYQTDIRVHSGNQIRSYSHNAGGSGAHDVITSATFDNPDDYYHMVFRYDSTQSTASDRIRFYVNGSASGFSSASYPSQNGYGYIGGHSSITYYIGGAGTSQRLDGYLSEFNYVDGLSLGPDSFGETEDSVWIPKEYTGSYGTTGFRLTGENSGAFGTDYSGNGNSFTSSGLATHDQVIDSPTNTFAVFDHRQVSGKSGVPQNGNLVHDGDGENAIQEITFDGTELDAQGGKWYFEILMNSSNHTVGFRLANGSDGTSVEIESDGQYKQNGSNSGSATGTISSGAILGVHLDFSGGTSARKFQVSVNGTLRGSQLTMSSTSDFVFHLRQNSGNAVLNFGQDGTFAGAKTAQGNSDANGFGNFYYAVPSGHLAICSKNGL